MGMGKVFVRFVGPHLYTRRPTVRRDARPQTPNLDTTRRPIRSTSPPSSVPGATIEDIDTVYSHPQGFAQCRPFFNKHRDWTLKPYFSTSRSAEKVAQDGKKNQAAVASRTASPRNTSPASR